MKYEINTPYDLKVKNVTEKEGLLTFEVEIGDYLFPVRAFPEQLEGGIPSMVSCRIIQDKNKDAYLIQNEAFYYPAIYKPNRKYLFEVVDIKDSYVVVRDKYDLIHTMEKDGSKLSKNEIIVRCIEIVKDNNFKAHLLFHIPEPIVKTEKEPTIIVEEQMQMQNAPTTNKREKGDWKRQVNESVSSMLSSRNWEALKEFLDNNLKGPRIHPIQEAIAMAIDKCSTSTLYWEIVSFLLNYDARMFLGTLAKADVSTNPDITSTSQIDQDIIDGVILSAFSSLDKTKYALEVIKPLKNSITKEQKKYILSKCTEIKTCETFFELFKLLNLSPDDAVLFLLTLKNNITAAFTLFSVYFDFLKGNFLDENSTCESFKPSKVVEYIIRMKGTQSIAFNAAADLINYYILSRGNCPRDLQKAVLDNGEDGFKKYIYRKEQLLKKVTNIQKD